MTRGSSRVGCRGGRGRGTPGEPSSSSPSSSRPPPVVTTSDSPASSPVPSPSDSTSPLTSSSTAGSSTCSLSVIDVEDHRLMPSCLATITKIFMKRIHRNGYTWKQVPDEYKESYFEEFKKFFKWDESIDKLVHKTFLSQGKIRYSDMVGRFKKDQNKGKPPCLSEETWRIWEAYWNRPDVIAKSEQQRKNRMTEVAGPCTGVSRNGGGSRSTTEHHHILEPDVFDTFACTHEKKNGQYIDVKSKKIVEEMQAPIDAAMQEAGDSNETPTINMSHLFVDVAGGIKKQCIIYGLGSKAASLVNSNASCNSNATSQLNQNAMKEVMEAVEKQVSEWMQARVEALIQAERAAMQAQVIGLLEELRRHGVLPTSMQLPTTPDEQIVNSNAANLGDD